MKKHAYLLLPYNNPEQLRKLVCLLDDERNDIYIHIDAKADFPMERLKNITVFAKCYVMDRIPVFWADYSESKAMLKMLRKAVENSDSEYSYYHFLSGMDIPLKTQDEIHDFFDKQDKEFIGIVPHESRYNIDHVRFYYPLLKCRTYKKNKFLKAANEGLVLFQRAVGVDKTKKFPSMHFYDGWGWCSITDNFARYILDNEELIEEIFKDAKCPDEMIFQTMAMNSKEFKDSFFDKDDLKKGSMRMIDWKRGRPYSFQAEDFHELMSSEYMFARKVDASTEDGGVLMDLIYNYLMEKRRNMPT